MTTDLRMLVWSAGLTLVLILPYLAGRTVTRGGLRWAHGNRDEKFDFPAWVGRAERAHANMLENIVPFAVLVLAGHVAGRTNETTALGATVFFWGRVVHAVTYLAGVVGVRTAAFWVSIAGQILILRELLRD